MEKKYIIAILIVVVFVLYALGSFASEQCTQIAEFKGCWRTTQTVAKSPYCPTDEPCAAQPQDQQNNAIVDVLLQACDKAKTDGYTDEDLNKKIEDVIKEFRGITITSQELCDQPGYLLVHRQYG